MSITTPPTPEEIKNDLNVIAHYLFNTPTPLLPAQKPTSEQAFLKRLDEQLKTYRTSYLQRSRALYQVVENSDLKSADGKKLIATLKNGLASQLAGMDMRDRIDGKPAKSFLVYDAGFTAIGNEARQAVSDRLLHPQAGELLQKLDMVPMLRPATYALQFSYQDTIVELAGAFLVTEKNTRQVKDLQTDQGMGYALLFTPARGIEFFNSLADLDNQLRASLNQASASQEFMHMLPTRYHAVGAAGIWPLSLVPIDSKPLFEHIYDALIEKRTQDIERALSFSDNPLQDPTLLLAALERAIAAALPDLTSRMEWRAQSLFERHLRDSAPHWYRSASTAQKNALTQHLRNYQQRRQHLLDLMGPAGSLTALARQQWLERLSEDLEIDDIEPEKLSLSTVRQVPGYGNYVQQSSLLELTLRGPHTGDELPDSAFLKHTTLTYNDEPLPPAYADVTPAWLIKQALELQPRTDFYDLQKALQARPAIKSAIEQMLDHRIVALAHTAVLQGHLLDSDLQLIQRLRDGRDSRLRAATVSLHGAQLQDLWVLCQNDDGGAIKRLLLCTPEAPREQQFQAFDSELECQTHLLGWARQSVADSMAGYLIRRAPMRFRQKVRQVLSGLSFKPEAHEHHKVTFAHGSHLDCLGAMARHMLATRTDDYDFSTPLWYRSTTSVNRRKLTTHGEGADGVLRAFISHALSGSRFPTFDDYVHEQAKISLNRLLKRTANDVDPDTVWAFSPTSIMPSWTPAPLTYTELYRDGYADGVGFLDEKFSRSARFRGPQGIDISNLTAENVARSVTGVWIGQRYIDKVKAELQSSTSEGYDFRRNATLAITRLQMKNAALECQLQGHIASHDLQWLERSIDSMGETSGATRTNYALHRLMIDGEWVIDTWLFSHGDNPVLLYTPDAPDGVVFREARLFNYLLKQLSGMLEYLVSRVSVSARPRVSKYLENIRKELPAGLNKTTPSPARYDSTHAVAAVSDLRFALYNMKLQRRIDDVNATTTSRAGMIAGLVWITVELFTAIATAPFPLLSLSSGLLLAFKDGMLALHAYRQGDHGEAFEHWLGYLFNSAGAVLTDLRPMLKPLKPTRSLLLPRLSSASARNQLEHVMAVIDDVAPQPHLKDMHVVSFRNQLFYTRNSPDELGRYLLYRFKPDSSELVSTGILTVRNSDGVLVRSGMVGGAPKYEPVPETPGPYKDYGVEPKYRERIETVMNPQTRQNILLRSQDDIAITPAVVMEGAAHELASTRTAYLKQVEKLSADATAHFAGLAPLAARAEVPAVAGDLSFARLIGSDTVKGKNLVIGARPDSIASKQLLIDNLDALVSHGYKRLYVEYLAGDVFNVKLAKMNKGGTWKHIKTHLEAVDRALGHEKDAPHSYLALVRAAREKGLKIHALDASTSYNLDGALVLADVSPLTPRSNLIRNFYSHKTLAADIADAPEERWVVLTEQSRMCTSDKTPGLADLHAAVAVRVEDVALDQSARISLDSAGTNAGDAAAKGDYRVQWPTAYKAPQPVSRPAPITSVVEHFSDYDIPASLRDDIANMLHQRHALDSRYSPSAPKERPAHDAFITNRERLGKKARDTFAQYTPPAAARLPTITSDTSFEGFLRQLADGRLNLLIGEAHSDVSSKVLLKKHMKALKQAGYDTLYMEHLFTDLHQADLDVFYRTQRMPDRLKAYLRVQDRGQMPTHAGNDTYTEVCQAAAKYNIRIRALDCTASYHVKGLRDTDISRNEMFSYFATQVIKADQLAHGPHKWVALIGSAHTNYNLGVPGLADTLSAVSLHVRDTAPELAKGIHRGGWEVVAGRMGTTSRALRSDFLMEVAVAGGEKPVPVQSVSRSKLTGAGMFMIDSSDTSALRLVHKSRTGEIVETPIQVNDHGLLFIDRWEKKDKRFKYLQNLINMLEHDLQMIRVR